MPSHADTLILSQALIGREPEQARLANWSVQIAGGHGSVLVIGGEAGIGKSRLLRELQAIAAHQSMLLLQGRCFEGDRHVPLAPFTDLLRNGDAAIIQEARFVQCAPQLLKLAPELLELLPDVVLAPIAEPEQEKRELFRAWRSWLATPQQQAASRRPTIVVIEDLHWCDDLSFELLLQLARAIAQQPVGIVLSYRSDESTPALQHLLAQFDRERLVQEMLLKPLSPSDTGLLIQAIFQQKAPISQEFVESVYALTEGNPFFTEEVLKSLVAAGDIFIHNGRWDRKKLAELHVPRTIQLAVSQRVAALDHTAQRFLRLASAVGQRFSIGIPQALLELTESEILACLQALHAAQLILEETADTWLFRHALTRQAVYGAMLKRERRPLHQAIAVYLEAIQQATGGIRPELLAYHFFEAGNWQLAARYAVLAGEYAKRLYAPAEALQHYLLALEATKEQGQPGSNELLQIVAQLYGILGKWEDARATYDDLIRRAVQQHHTRLEWQCLLDLGFLSIAFDYRQAHEYLQRALAVARNLDDPLALAHTLNRIGNWQANTHDPATSLAYHREALGLFLQANDQGGQAQTYDYLGTASCILGAIPAAAVYYNQAIMLFRELDDRAGLASALAMSSLQGCGYAIDTIPCPIVPLYDCQQAGEEAIRIAQAIGARPIEAYARMIYALALGARGEYGRALECARISYQIAEETEHHANRASAHWVLGAIACDLLDFTRAQQHLEQAIGIVQGRGAEFLLGHVRACLARVHIAQSAGNAKAEQELQLAAAVLDVMQNDATPMQTVWQRALWAARAELVLARNRPQAALAIIDRLLATMDQGAIARLQYLRGIALIELEQYELAESVLQVAHSAAQEAGMRSLLWRILLIRGRCAHVQRQLASAQEYYEAALSTVQVLTSTLEVPLRNHVIRYATAHIPRLPGPNANQIAKTRYGGLTTREREVAGLLAQGKLNREIASAFVLSERTVEKHVENIMHKLGFETRAQVAVWAAQQFLRTEDT
jgi:DNA-binding NarL/FixJ family response regulator/energy-coupling factor transporter ATP-binding protein EcfA2